MAKRPAYCMLENVKALTHKKFMPLFQRWCDELDSYGYTNHWQILNAKDYGVPQNRERVFLISVRKDMAGDFPYGYKFPKPFPLKRHLEDVLEPECDVPRSYYISEKSKAYFSGHCDINMVKLLGVLILPEMSKFMEMHVFLVVYSSVEMFTFMIILEYVVIVILVVKFKFLAMPLFLIGLLFVILQ